MTVVCMDADAYTPGSPACRILAFGEAAKAKVIALHKLTVENELCFIEGNQTFGSKQVDTSRRMKNQKITDESFDCGRDNEALPQL